MTRQKTNQAKVSILVPIYRMQTYLEECLDSLLGQTLADLEIIMIDDCSPDRCGEVPAV